MNLRLSTRPTGLTTSWSAWPGQESRDTPSAYNARSGAAGSLQFLYGTWMSTPQGKAGLSRYDPYCVASGGALDDQRWSAARVVDVEDVRMTQTLARRSRRA